MEPTFPTEAKDTDSEIPFDLDTLLREKAWLEMAIHHRIQVLVCSL
jgi:hypothetical protein